jgi:hypothetical protein
MSFIKNSAPLLILLILCSTLSAPVSGQTPTATLNGTILDEKGAVVVRARVAVVNTSTSLQREVTTNDEGYFTVPLLPPGNYRLSALGDGFCPIEIQAIVLRANDQKSLKIQLTPGPTLQSTTQNIEPVTWSLKIKRHSRAHKRGDTFEVEAIARIEQGWRLYSLKKIEGGASPTLITVSGVEAFELAGDIRSPNSLTGRDPNFAAEVEYFKQEATFTLPIKVRANATTGSRELEIRVGFQTCNAKLCLPPKTVKVDAQIELVD